MNNFFSEQEWNDIITEVNDMQHGHPYLRFGQCLWNIAYEKKPDVVDLLRGTDKDPFHVGSHLYHERVQAFKNEIVDI